MVFYEQMIITLDRDHYQGDSGEVELVHTPSKIEIHREIDSLGNKKDSNVYIMLKLPCNIQLIS